MRPLIAALAALALAAAAQAQAPAPAPAQPPLTIEGVTVQPAKPIDPETLRAMVQDFVRLHGQPSRYGQLSIWARPLCPVVAGLPPAMDAFVSDRIRQVAEVVGAPVQKRPSDCRRFNVLVVVTSEPQQLLDYVRSRQPELLGFHYAAQAERIATVRRPIQAWHVTATATKTTTSDINGTASGPGEEIDTPFHMAAGGSAGSLLSAGLQSHFLTAFVVVDARRIAGEPIGRVADQIALEALAQPATKVGCSQAPTVLDVLDSTCAASVGVDGLTVFDTAYLKGLYHVDPEQLGSLQKSAVGSEMKHDLAAARP